MPTTLLRVFNVSGPAPASGGGRANYLISGVLTETPSLGLQVSTLIPWQAALCQRAKDTHQPIVVRWHETRWGNDLDHCELVDLEATA